MLCVLGHTCSHGAWCTRRSQRIVLEIDLRLPSLVTSALTHGVIFLSSPNQFISIILAQSAITVLISNAPFKGMGSNHIG